ncbi:MAG: hypothetical protein C5B43_00855 [Verrucomicrobia bacterium]|nr:MAG: hypothetical protein C5B43_00855 [Verrucomicrobiota bacterium]
MNKKIIRLSTIIIALFLIGCAHIPVATSLGIHVPSEIQPFEKSKKKIEVALVLGGGGARGIAHVGVLEVLEKEGIPIDLIVGTSAGAVVGALYGSFYDVHKVKSMLLGLNKWDVLDISMCSMWRMVYEASGPISGYALQKFLKETIPETNIEELRIPFAAVAVDIETSSPFIMRSGPIAPAVHASAAIPPFFAPVKLYGKTLVDGGVALPVPVSVAKEYNPKLIIAVNISSPPKKGELEGCVDLSYRSLVVSYYVLSNMQSQQADVVIHPELDGFGLFDDKNKEEVYRRGLAAAQAAIPAIKEKLYALKIPLRNSHSLNN